MSAMVGARIRFALALALALAGCGLIVDADGLTGGRTTDPQSDGGAPDADAVGAERTEAASTDATATATDGDAVADAVADGSTDGAPATRAYAAAVMADQPLLYLPFGEPAGSTSVKDLSGHLQPAIVGTPTFGRPGAIVGDPDTAVALDQAGFDCGPVFDFSGLQAFTLEVWARIPPNLAANDPRFLARKGDFIDGGAPAESYAFYLNVYSGGVASNVILSRRTGALSITTDTPIDPNITRFRHLVAVFTGRQLLLYVDAALFGSDVEDRIAAPIGGNFYIGLRNDMTGFVRTEIDEFAVYDTALTSERIRAHYDIGRGVGAEP